MKTLHEKIALVAPIDGVAYSGRIDFKPEATQQQKAAAEAIMAEYLANPSAWEAANENPLDLAEAHIKEFFSTARLLQIKVWMDAIPREATPKLNTTLQWEDGVTRQAITGDTNFSSAPFTFQEIAQECLSV